MVKIISWNINGLNAMSKKGNLKEMIESNTDTDIICLQEIRCSDEVAQKELSKFQQLYPHIYYNTSKTRKGYSGTAILSKHEPLEATVDLDCHKENDEGRVITAEYEKYIIVNVYTPNSGDGLKRLDYRTKSWDVHFRKHLNELQQTKKKPLVVCGDLNVAHTAMDIFKPTYQHTKVAGYTPEEQHSFGILINDLDLVDSFRYKHPTTKKFSYWSNLGASKDPVTGERITPRQANKGWRIDYFLVSKALKGKITKADILTDVMGSDHAPVVIALN